MEEKLKYISYNMKSSRVRLGYSQEKMADLLGISRATYNDYEVNPQRLKIETMQQIANILHCDIVDFFVKIKVTNSYNDEIEGE